MKKINLLGIGVLGLFAIVKYLGRPQIQIDAMARTIWGESRNQGYTGMLAVAHTIKNRMNDRRWGNTALSVVFQAWQFSMWNDDDPNGAVANDVDILDLQFKTAVEIASRVLNGDVPDNTGGATHYHTDGIDFPKGWGRRSAYRQTDKIGNHIFYKELA